MASRGVFSKTLETVTSTKLEELSNKQTIFGERYNALLSALRAERNPIERLRVLAKGTKICFGVKTNAASDGCTGNVSFNTTHDPRIGHDIRHLERFIEQAGFDPSVSPEILQDWEDRILRHLSAQASRLQYADLYGKLVTEWLSSEKDDRSDGSDINMDADFEKIPGHEKLQAQQEWERLAFQPNNIDTAQIQTYLEELFGANTYDEQAKLAMDELRGKVRDFEIQMARPSQFSIGTLRWSIKGLMKSDLLSDEKREVVGEFLNSEVILSEIADVLNMRLEAIDSWSWDDHVRVEQRRKLNGRFSAQMDEDLLTAIFLYYIGTKWSVYFKAAFREILQNGKVWKSSRTAITKLDRMRRSYYLGSEYAESYGSVQSKRINNHRDGYFTYQLLDNVRQHIEVADGEDEAELGRNKEPNSSRKRKRAAPRSSRPPNVRRQVGGKACRIAIPKRSAEEEDDEDDEDEEEEEDEEDEDNAQSSKSPMDTKQTLLHLLSTEVVLNTGLHGELTCFRTVFNSWSRMLPHKTVSTVLNFFGVSPTWITFFDKFLRTPLETGSTLHSEKRFRERGTPESHVLSDVLSEVVLFCLDFSVNKSTDGQFLHRMSDDVWFWHKDYEVCALAWGSLDEFAGVMGVEMDMDKTGSIRIGQDGELEMDDRLPEGDIQWGFLHLDPSSGHFRINQKMVDAHAKELRQQLEGRSRSIIEWVQAWNSFAGTFFSTNFGKAANCFGRDHVDNMLTTHRRVQEIVFDGGNVVQHLRGMIEERFGVSDVPDGFFVFPAELGGLAVSSPFIDLLGIRNSVMENPRQELEEFLRQEQSDYSEAEHKFYKQDSRTRYSMQYPDFLPADPDAFLSFEEYTRYREDLISPGKADLCKVYDKLFYRPTPQPVEQSLDLKLRLSQLKGQYLQGIIKHWQAMTPYWQYVVSTYGSQMIERFGGLNIVEPGWLPIGMISQLRQRRTKWQD